jgi:hypothetical protein
MMKAVDWFITIATWIVVGYAVLALGALVIASLLERWAVGNVLVGGAVFGVVFGPAVVRGLVYFAQTRKHQ